MLLDSRDVDFQHRPDGHFLPYSNPSIFPEIFEDRISREGFPVPGFSFGVKIAPWIFTTVFKEMKVMALARGGGGHYPSVHGRLVGENYRFYLCGTCSAAMVAICSELGIKVNLTKSALVPKQILDFLGYRFDLVR